MTKTTVAIVQNATEFNLENAEIVEILDLSKEITDAMPRKFMAFLTADAGNMPAGTLVELRAIPGEFVNGLVVDKDGFEIPVKYAEVFDLAGVTSGKSVVNKPVDVSGFDVYGFPLVDLAYE